ncbi:hypothetical protein [Paraburkholderia oxyphila]|uniref:hypothetical protein n=1 Tax=Paraburkholderia oxyphila TaxID=614212 RepID=UPI0012ED0973|nr:hypothetical protein [Paraburkholderia oxyphila]
MHAATHGTTARMANAAAVRAGVFRGAAMIARHDDRVRGKRNRRQAGTSLHGLACARATHGEERKQPNEEETTQDSHAWRSGEGTQLMHIMIAHSRFVTRARSYCGREYDKETARRAR